MAGKTEDFRDDAIFEPESKTIKDLAECIEANVNRAAKLRSDADAIEATLGSAKAELAKRLGFSSAPPTAPAESKKEGKRERGPNKKITQAMKDELPALLTGLLKEGLTKFPDMLERLEAYNRKTVDEALQGMVKDGLVKREGELSKTTYSLPAAKPAKK